MAFENSQINVYNKYLPKGFLLDENFQEPSTDGSDIVNYFNNKYIFLTGGTGFLGKLLVEKLLRTCPDISGIFVLVRAKKGKDFHSRLDDIYEDVVSNPFVFYFLSTVIVQNFANYLCID